MKVYITRYALTRGIYEEDVEVVDSIPNGFMVRVCGSKYTQFYHKPDWHENKEDAVKKANKMRNSKIAMLERQLLKLKKLTFE